MPLGTVRAPSEEDPDQEGPVSCSVLMGPLDTEPIGPGDRLVLATLLWAKNNADVGAPRALPGRPSAIRQYLDADPGQARRQAPRRRAARQGQAWLGRPSEIPAEGRRPPRDGRHSPTVDPWPADRRPSMEGSISPAPLSDSTRSPKLEIRNTDVAKLAS